MAGICINIEEMTTAVKQVMKCIVLGSSDVRMEGVNSLKCSGIRWLHFEVFSAIHV